MGLEGRRKQFEQHIKLLGASALAAIGLLGLPQETHGQTKGETLTGKLVVIYGETQGGEERRQVLLEMYSPLGSHKSTTQLDLLSKSPLMDRLVAKEGAIVRVETQNNVTTDFQQPLYTDQVLPTDVLPDKLLMVDLPCETIDTNSVGTVPRYPVYEQRYWNRQFGTERMSLGIQLPEVRTQKSKAAYLGPNNYPLFLDIAQDCIDAARSTGFDFSMASTVNLILPVGFSYTSWGGRLTIRTGETTQPMGITWMAYEDWMLKYLRIHEEGHSMGLKHAASNPNGTTYDNLSTPMGNPYFGCDLSTIVDVGCLSQDLNAADKNILGVEKLIPVPDGQTIKKMLGTHEALSVVFPDETVLLVEARNGEDKRKKGIVVHWVNNNRLNPAWIVGPGKTGDSPEMVLSAGGALDFQGVRVCIGKTEVAVSNRDLTPCGSIVGLPIISR